MSILFLFPDHLKLLSTYHTYNINKYHGSYCQYSGLYLYPSINGGFIVSHEVDNLRNYLKQ